MKLEKQAAIRFPLDTYNWLQAESDRSGLAISDLVRQAVALLIAGKESETVPYTYQKAMEDRQTGTDETWLGDLYARLTAYDDGAVVLSYGEAEREGWGGSHSIWMVKPKS